MKSLTLAAVLLLAASAAQAQNTAPASAAPVCLRVNEIKSTDSPDPYTINFHMLNGTVWKNTLKSRCDGLGFNGFSYLALNDEVCGNMQSIRVNTNRTICMLGSFTKVSPASP